MIRKKLVQYFFIIASVISILDAAFPQQVDMQPLKLALLTISGIVVAVLIEERYQQSFLIGALSVLFGSFVFSEFLAESVLLSGLLQMILNFNIFLAAMVIVVGIERVSTLITASHETTVKEKLADLKKLNKHEVTFEKVWGTLILIAVATTFIILLAELFFDTNGFLPILLIVDAIISALFIVDLFVLYKKSKNFGDFVKNHVFDIIAAVPLYGILRALKIVRAVKIIRGVARGGSHLPKVLKMHKTVKFFSEKSSFNEVQQKKPVKKKSTKTKKDIKKKAASKKHK